MGAKMGDNLISMFSFSAARTSKLAHWPLVSRSRAPSRSAADSVPLARPLWALVIIRASPGRRADPRRSEPRGIGLFGLAARPELSHASPD